MQDEIKLQEPFDYNTIIIYVLFIVIIVLIVSLFIKKNKKTPKEVILVHYPDLLSIKNNYLQKLDDLLNKVNSKQYKKSEAYYKLSNIIRSFIYEVTNINVLSLSLIELDNYDIPYLKELMAEYYPPEFSRVSMSDIILSIQKTKEVITKWK